MGHDRRMRDTDSQCRRAFRARKLERVIEKPAAAPHVRGTSIIGEGFRPARAGQAFPAGAEILSHLASSPAPSTLSAI